MIRRSNQLAIKAMGMILLCIELLVGFSIQAQAATFVYYTDPYDNAAIFYVTTTTTTITATIGDIWDPYEFKYLRTGLYYQNQSNGDWYNTHIFSSPNTNYRYRYYASFTLMSGLTPGTTYNIVYGGSNQIYFMGSVGKRAFITEPNAPTSPMFSNISQSGVSINWTTNGNGMATNYKLYRSTSATGPWTTLYSGGNLYYTDTGLAPDTKYYYRLGSYVTGGEEHYAPIMNITTSADPAVAAAQAAQGAAEASMIASQNANTTVTELKTLVNGLQTNFNQFISTDTKDPVIASFAYAVPKATITSQAIVNYSLVAADNTSLQYRYKINDGAFTGWAALDAETVSINLGATPGIKRITMQVMDTGGNTATATASIFKI